MQQLPEPLEFEWDKGNIDKSVIKHNISNEQAEEVFKNEPRLILDSSKKGEKRYMLWGFTNSGKKLTVVFTLRNKKVRIISARPMSRIERKGYAKKAKTNTKI